MKKQVIWALVLVLLLVLALTSWTAEKKDKQQEAAALLARAAEVSNIRCARCPPFRLQAHVRLAGLSGGSVEGSYVLLWASPTKWREEMTFPDFTQLRVLAEGKLWLHRSSNYEPLRIHQLAGTLTFHSRLKVSPQQKLTKIQERQWQGREVSCVEVKPKSGKYELCFDPPSGVLVREDYPIVSYQYGDHADWGASCFRTPSAFSSATSQLWKCR